MENQGEHGGVQTTQEATTSPSLPAYGHAPFLGTFRCKLEATGRLALPADLRGPFGATAVVRPHRRAYLNLWTPTAFRLVADQIVAGGVVDPRTRKRFHMSATEVSVDKQRRLVIPPELRERVGLGEQVVLAGSIESIEIWSAETFAEEEEAFDDADLALDGFEGL
jgi:MraZ protein